LHHLYVQIQGVLIVLLALSSLQDDDLPAFGTTPQLTVLGPTDIFPPENFTDHDSSSDEDTEEMQQIFEKIDSNRDGYITIEEMLAHQKRIAFHRGSVFDEVKERSDLLNFLRHGDLNKDQRLDFHEFVVAEKMRVMEQSMHSDSDNEDTVAKLPTARIAAARRRSVAQNLTRRPSNITNTSSMSSIVVGHGPVAEAVRRRRKSARSMEVRWEADKKQVVDPTSEDVRPKVEQLFDQLDGDKDGFIEARDLLKLEGLMAKGDVAVTPAVRQKRQAALKKFVDNLETTNAEAKLTTDDVANAIAVRLVTFAGRVG